MRFNRGNKPKKAKTNKKINKEKKTQDISTFTGFIKIKLTKSIEDFNELA